MTWDIVLRNIDTDATTVLHLGNELLELCRQRGFDPEKFTFNPEHVENAEKNLHPSRPMGRANASVWDGGTYNGPSHVYNGTPKGAR